ncbi:MAG: bacterioferritin-associated ferredoxin [Planctomycetota bacterium]|jgi:bacterioferritin-associated ferredoxin
MEADDELCLCFHISCRKVLNYIRVHQVKIPSQLADCGGAGTGCGWCRKQLKKLMILASEDPPAADCIEDWLKSNTPDRQKYAEARARYKKAKELDSSLSGDSAEADE